MNNLNERAPYRKHVSYPNAYWRFFPEHFTSLITRDIFSLSDIQFDSTLSLILSKELNFNESQRETHELMCAKWVSRFSSLYRLMSINIVVGVKK